MKNKSWIILVFICFGCVLIGFNLIISKINKKQTSEYQISQTDIQMNSLNEKVENKIATEQLEIIVNSLEKNNNKYNAVVNFKMDKCIKNIYDITDVSKKESILEDNSQYGLEVTVNREFIEDKNYRYEIEMASGYTFVKEFKLDDCTLPSKEVIDNKEYILRIYSVEDLVEFRKTVNEGNSYTGYTVNVLADIDMSTVCSSSLGSWTPIGAGTALKFNGTFNGNGHKISNLYINTSSNTNFGLFSITDSLSIIENLIMYEPQVYNYFENDFVVIGSIVGENFGNIINCASINGVIKGIQTTGASVSKRAICGGIVGRHTNGLIEGCYNTSEVLGDVNDTSELCQARVGGIAGRNYNGIIRNCYNKGNISANGCIAFCGGIVGTNIKDTKSANVYNCYNIGSISIWANGENHVRKGGIVGGNGDSEHTVLGTISNSYCLDNIAYSYYYLSGSSFAKSATGVVSSEILKGYASTLGSYFKEDTGINDGYPILTWQIEENM